MKLIVIEINECESNPCVNGDCDDAFMEYSCECDPGYEGDICDSGTQHNMKVFIFVALIN